MSKAERRKLAIAYCERIRKKTEGLGSRQRSKEIAKAITDLRQSIREEREWRICEPTSVNNKKKTFDNL